MSAALISPMLPSLMRSRSEIPLVWYFFAIETTKRRFALISFSFAFSSPARVARESASSSVRLRSGILFIWSRYQDIDESEKLSAVDFLRAPAACRLRPFFFSPAAVSSASSSRSSSKLPDNSSSSGISNNSSSGISCSRDVSLFFARADGFFAFFTIHTLVVIVSGVYCTAGIPASHSY